MAQRLPFVGHLADGRLTSQPAPGLANAAEPPPEEEQTFFGTPVSELCEQELWKFEKNGLDTWDDLLAHAAADKFPDKKFNFFFRFHGLFHVAPAQNSFMLRLRIPGGELTHQQLRGLAEIADDWGGGYAHVTTRANLQIREILPRNMVKVLTKLQDLGLTARGSGVDNVRNITASATAGIDAAELIDTRPMAKGLHYYILNNRDLYGLPRKFNVAFDGGGAIGNVRGYQRHRLHGGARRRRAGGRAGRLLSHRARGHHRATSSSRATRGSSSSRTTRSRSPRRSSASSTSTATGRIARRRGSNI